MFLRLPHHVGYHLRRSVPAKEGGDQVARLLLTQSCIIFASGVALVMALQLDGVIVFFLKFAVEVAHMYLDGLSARSCGILLSLRLWQNRWALLVDA